MKTSSDVVEWHTDSHGTGHTSSKSTVLDDLHRSKPEVHILLNPIEDSTGDSDESSKFESMSHSSSEKSTFLRDLNEPIHE